MIAASSHCRRRGRRRRDESRRGPAARCRRWPGAWASTRRSGDKSRSSSPRRRPTCSSTRGGGELIIQGLEDGRVGGLEVLALDRGPGMADVGRCLTDGFSTAGSPGTAWGRSRVSRSFDIHSSAGDGNGDVVPALAVGTTRRRTLRVWSSAS